MSSLSLCISLLSPTWAADSETLLYTLRLNGQEIGHRQVDLRFVQEELGESRLIESWTEMDIPASRGVWAYRHSLGGRHIGRTGGFTSRLSMGGGLTEVQAVRHDERWIVTITESGQTSQREYPSRDVELTSLSLVDPQLAEHLTPENRLQLLAAESGDLLVGRLEERSPSTAQVGGETVEVQRWVWSTDQGDVTLAYGPRGYLIGYSIPLAGSQLSAELQSLPAPRTYGDVIDTSELMRGLGEEEL